MNAERWVDMLNADTGKATMDIDQISNSFTRLADAVNLSTGGYLNYFRDFCCTDQKTETERQVKQQTNKDKFKEDNKMNMNNMFNGIFGRVAPDMCRLTMSGKIAIKTDNGYKAYDVNKGRLTNCDNFAFNIGEDFFFVIPTNKVERGDIILASGKPRCVLEVYKNEIKTFCYEDSTISTIVKEHHIFMGQQYFYGKIISLFGNTFGNTKGMNKMMQYMMMTEMMKSSQERNPMRNGPDMTTMLPMMFMMSGNNFFDGIFDFDEEDREEDESPDEEKSVSEENS